MASKEQPQITAAQWMALQSFNGRLANESSQDPAKSQDIHPDRYDATRRCWLYWDVRCAEYVTRAELFAPRRTK